MTANPLPRPLRALLLVVLVAIGLAAPGCGEEGTETPSASTTSGPIGLTYDDFISQIENHPESIVEVKLDTEADTAFIVEATGSYGIDYPPDKERSIIDALEANEIKFKKSGAS